MAKLRLETVRGEIEERGWKLISEKYENLDGELSLECPEHHKTYMSLKKFRQGAKCPMCKDNPFKEMDSKIIPKNPDKKRFLALDQATYITGWAIYDDGALVKYGTYETSLEEEVRRLDAVRSWLVSMITNWKPDLVGIEDIQLQTFGAKDIKDADNVVGIQTFKVLAHLQGALLVTLHEYGIKVEICPPATWRAHCKVKGAKKADKKKSMQLLVKEWFDISIGNDEADAIGIGKYLSDTFSKKKEFVIGDWIE